jgi:DNA polymerase III delta prime subunit
MENNQLLSELLRPQSLDDINLPIDLLNSLKRMECSGFPMNLTFYGKPGIGKTSAARILVRNSDVYELNGSFNCGDKAMVKDIERFGSTMSLANLPKVVFIDEADFMPATVQDALRHTIEKFTKGTRFILTANDISKIKSPIQSRCTPICFDVPIKHQAEVVERMCQRYEIRLTELGVNFHPQRLREIAGLYFPDLRDIANHFQLEFGF